MDTIDFVNQLKTEKPKIYGNLSEKRVDALIRNVFIHLGQCLNDTQEGVVKVRGLGKFRIRQVDREKNGKRVSSKRIIFNPVKPKSKPADE